MVDRQNPGTAGLSLYANLLKPNSNGGQGTISSAPVLYANANADTPLALHEQPSEGKAQISSATFRLQPTRRPQVAPQKVKPKNITQRPLGVLAPTQTTSSAVDEGPDRDAIAPRVHSKTLADWTAAGDEDGFQDQVSAEKRQRGGRKKRKKNKQEVETLQKWDDIYDPSRPNVFDEYKHSDERILELQEWKERLYSHRSVKKPVSELDSEDDSPRPAFNRRFAPPVQFSQMPLPGGKGASSPGSEQPTSALIESPASNGPGFPSSEDPNLDRLVRSSVDLSARHASVGRGSTPTLPPPALHLLSQQAHHQTPEDVPPPPSSSSHISRTSASAPSIERGPVTYKPLAPPRGMPTSEAELAGAPQDEAETSVLGLADAVDDRSARPGQKGFAQRLMSKYGWTKGSGLGAGGTGITAPLRVQLEKQKKKPDSEGGGFATPGGMGKIVGGGRKGGSTSEQSKFGRMSKVICLTGMLDGMDINQEMEGDGGGLVQEIGEECGEKYGRVERVSVDRTDPAAPVVYVVFTAELSALRAVNALEGRIFNGNAIVAKFSQHDEM